MTKQKHSEPPTEEQLDKWANVYRSMMMHENELQNQRMTWLLAIQGLFMGALAFAWDKHDARMLIFVFCGLGFLICLTFWEGLRISKVAQGNMRDEWDKKKALVPSYCDPDIVGYRSPKGSLLKYIRPWRSLPLVFMVAWGLIAFLNWFRP